MITIERVKNVPEDFLVDDPEGGAFYRAYGRARVPGFELGCFVVKRAMIGFHQLMSPIPAFSILRSPSVPR